MKMLSPFKIAPLITIGLAVAFLVFSQVSEAQVAKPSGPDKNVIARSDGYASGPPSFYRLRPVLGQAFWPA